MQNACVNRSMWEWEMEKRERDAAQKSNKFAKRNLAFFRSTMAAAAIVIFYGRTSSSICIKSDYFLFFVNRVRFILHFGEAAWNICNGNGDERREINVNGPTRVACVFAYRAHRFQRGNQIKTLSFRFEHLCFYFRSDAGHSHLSHIHTAVMASGSGCPFSNRQKFYRRITARPSYPLFVGAFHAL